ncbi:hypothetical protein SMSK597_1156 [Streptococcus mitis SK597]|uniref:Uncharacterized protein n=1 Tax=Streptococcus mitis SK597 TaxID=585204 RepID=E1LT62_STRMT|nr:hypothetical protein SMSK597_1156 [Streptococcus mitis SK597]
MALSPIQIPKKIRTRMVVKIKLSKYKENSCSSMISLISIFFKE